ncbi:hypothetical protein FB107DRAFT_260151, partial [Schizophyllum commune]
MSNSVSLSLSHRDALARFKALFHQYTQPDTPIPLEILPTILDLLRYSLRPSDIDVLAFRPDSVDIIHRATMALSLRSALLVCSTIISRKPVFAPLKSVALDSLAHGVVHINRGCSAPEGHQRRCCTP